MLDRSRRIELDELVGREVRRVLTAMENPDVFPTSMAGTTNDERVAELVESARRYWQLAEPFCASLRAAARWADPDALSPWATGLKTLVAAGNKTVAGHRAATAQRHLPGMLAIMVAGLACSATGRWDNLKALVVEPTIVSSHDNNRTLRVIGATHPWAAFTDAELAAHVLARSTIANEDIASAVAHVRRSKYYTPVAEWLHAILRPFFADQFHDPDDFDTEFDRAEVMLGFLSTDDSHLVAEETGSSWFKGSSRWFGRSTHRAANWKGDPVGYFDGQLNADGSRWAPLTAGLFGASEERARRAINDYTAQFNEIKRQRF